VKLRFSYQAVAKTSVIFVAEVLSVVAVSRIGSMADRRGGIHEKRVRELKARCLQPYRTQ